MVESVPLHTLSRLCAWTTQGNFLYPLFSIFFIFPIAGSRSKHSTPTTSPSATTPARPSPLPSPTVLLLKGYLCSCDVQKASRFLKEDTHFHREQDWNFSQASFVITITLFSDGLNIL